MSIITYIELLSFPDISADEEEQIKEFLPTCEIIPLDDAIVQTTITFRRKTKRKVPDSIIAATAIETGSLLFTRDDHLLKADFPGLKTKSII
jgi:predicted nucleic acid-binding protein